MDKLEEDEKPDLGPHVFVAASNSYTGFHQDLYGTVDSVHYCHTGCNEVVMLGRLSDAQKMEAMRILFSQGHSKSGAKKFALNVLSDLPHSPTSVSKMSSYFGIVSLLLYLLLTFLYSLRSMDFAGQLLKPSRNGGRRSMSYVLLVFYVISFLGISSLHTAVNLQF